MYKRQGDPCIMQIEPELIEALVQRGDVAEARVVHREFLDLSLIHISEPTRPY